MQLISIPQENLKNLKYCCICTYLHSVTLFTNQKKIPNIKNLKSTRRWRNNFLWCPFRLCPDFSCGNICGNIEILLEYYSWVVVKYSEQRAIAGTYSREISRLLRKYRISTGLWCSGNSSLSIAVFESKKVLYCFQNQSRFRFWFRNS